MTPTLSSKPDAKNICPRILLVDDEADLLEMVSDVVSRQMPCRITTAPSREAALSIMRREPVELMVVDIHLPDGDGLTLLEELRRHQPLAQAIVMTGAPSVDGAVSALRGGATDFVSKPFSADALGGQVREALERQAKMVREDKRLGRLRNTVKRLNAARKLVSKKVDLLCNDLVSAYGELARQMDTVRLQESFRKYLEGAKDLEQLLCNVMDWVLRQFGYANIAIWLAAEDNDYQLGAYMKYTINGDSELADAMKEGCLTSVLRHGAVNWSVEQMQERLSEPELDYLADQALMGIGCTYLGESLGALVAFRDGDKPFTDEDYQTLKLIGPIFSVALATLVRGDQTYQTEDTPFSDGGVTDEPLGGGGASSDGDWWKRGESPPF